MVACSVVLTLLRDLYEDKKTPTDVHPDASFRPAPLLDSSAAYRLRRIVRWFVRILVFFYAIIALGVLAIELAPNKQTDPTKPVVFLDFPGWGFDVKLSLIGIYQFATTGHLLTVVTVAGIVACMVRVRDNEARERWGQPHDRP
jgi:hypothetical protein